MKVCPRCQSVFADDLNFCLEDGTTLIAIAPPDHEKTLAFSDEPTLEKAISPTAGQNRQTNPEKNSAYNQTEKRRTNPLFGVIIILLGALLLISGVFAGAYYLREKTRTLTNATPTVNPTAFPIVKIPHAPVNTDQKPNLKIDVAGKVDGSFGGKYLKCLVTNVGENVVSSPSVSVTFYKNDVKLNSNFEDSNLKFLKPQQTIPVWVRLPKNDDSTRTFAEAGFVSAIADKTVEELYPNLSYSETQMTSKKVTSLFNFKPYPETFYTVTGVVTNENYDTVSPNIYILFYDENKEIVGIDSDSVGELKKGEKAKFDLGKGSSQLFGTPKTYEIFSISD